MRPSAGNDVLCADHRLHWYVVESVLGQGGFGITYLARDENLKQSVAMKEYFPAALARRDADQGVTPRTEGHRKLFDWGRERFLMEAQTLAALRHPNIVTVLSVFEANGTAYMVMRYETGTSLTQLLRAGESFGEEGIRGILDALLDGLQAIHRAGFIHRDIKPDNIYIRDDGTPILLDFGSARQAIGGATRALTALVTPGYAPLEQYDETQAEGRQGPWTDIYALAATLHHLVLGRAPPDAVTRAHSALAGRAGEMDLLDAASARYSTSLIEGIKAGLAIAAGDRPADIEEWRRLLDPARPKAGVAAKAAPAAVPPAEPEAAPGTGGRRSPGGGVDPDAPTLMAVPAARAAGARGRGPVLAALAVAGVAAVLVFSLGERETAEPVPETPAPASALSAAASSTADQHPSASPGPEASPAVKSRADSGVTTLPSGARLETDTGAARPTVESPASPALADGPSPVPGAEARLPAGRATSPQLVNGISATGIEIPAMSGFDEAVTRFMKKWEIPGGTVGVAYGGRLIFARGYGYADQENAVLMRPTHRLRIASLSKPITAAAVLLLAHQERFKLGDGMVATLPGIGVAPGFVLPDLTREVTIRHLLQHTSGWGLAGAQARFRDLVARVGSPAPPWSMRRHLYPSALAVPPRQQPGTGFEYSVFGYCVLGMLVEEVSGRSFESFVREEVLDPVGAGGMRMAQRTPEHAHGDEVRYYDERGARGDEVTPDGAVGTISRPDNYWGWSDCNSGGRLVATVEEYLRFMTAVSGFRDGLPLGRESRLEMTNFDGAAPTGGRSRYAAGWRLGRFENGLTWRSHSGGLPGSSAFAFQMSNGVDAVWIFNTWRSHPDFPHELAFVFGKQWRDEDRWPKHDLFGRLAPHPGGGEIRLPGGTGGEAQKKN